MSTSVGIIGLGPIGKNLVLNVEEKRDVHIFNRTHSKVREVVDATSNVKGYVTMTDMMCSMEHPRTIISTLPHGRVTDEVMNNILTLAQPGDTFVDCANEHYKTSRDRYARCKVRDINYLGVGLSGGANGARTGPALMIGGDQKVFEQHEDLFNSFCKNVAYVGDDAGIGHFTKMVHNGVEYGMLQAIADVYAYCNQDDTMMKNVLDVLSNTDLDGYLTQSARNVVDMYDMSKISDTAAMNNTGLWCSGVAAEYGVPVPVMNAAINARVTSCHIKHIHPTTRQNTTRAVPTAVNALRFAYAYSIIEGFNVMETQRVPRDTIMKAWSKGTIIDCTMIKKNCHEILDETFMEARVFVLQCVASGIPCPAIQAAVTQYDFTHQARTSMSFLMAQRNYFGQHSLIEV